MKWYKQDKEKKNISTNENIAVQKKSIMAQTETVELLIKIINHLLKNYPLSPPLDHWLQPLPTKLSGLALYVYLGGDWLNGTQWGRERLLLSLEIFCVSDAMPTIPTWIHFFYFSFLNSRKKYTKVLLKIILDREVINSLYLLCGQPSICRIVRVGSFQLLIVPGDEDSNPVGQPGNV